MVLDVSVQQGNDTAVLVKRVTLAPLEWAFVNTADLPKLQQAAKIIIRCVWSTSCDSDKAPMMVLGAIDVAAAAAVSGSS